MSCRNSKSTTKVERTGDNAYLIPSGGQQGQLLQRRAYVMSYNAKTRQPDWVAWHLTSAHTDGPLKYRNFNEDKSVGTPRATLADYKDCGWSRGHICPAGDNKWDEQARNECFLLSNICPQDQRLNGGTWNQIEMKCRDWAKRYGDVYIVSGPIFYTKNPATIGRNKIAVPDAFFKVVLRTAGRGAPRAIGFICPNNSNTGKMGQYVKSVAEVERVTGMTFFPTVAKNVKQTASLSDW